MAMKAIEICRIARLGIFSILRVGCNSNSLLGIGRKLTKLFRTRQIFRFWAAKRRKVGAGVGGVGKEKQLTSRDEICSCRCRPRTRKKKARKIWSKQNSSS